jgi:hypothetical protein
MPNLKLKNKPKQLLGSLLLDITLPISGVQLLTFILKVRIGLKFSSRADTRLTYLPRGSVTKKKLPETLTPRAFTIKHYTPVIYFVFYLS